eukprot:scaffold2349_cov407-Prasinococcus_capsulatus_cf.AAC.3
MWCASPGQRAWLSGSCVLVTPAADQGDAREETVSNREEDRGGGGQGKGVCQGQEQEEYVSYYVQLLP